MYMIDMRPLHRQALELVTALLPAVTLNQLARPTPCAGWDLRQLLEHMIGQNHGFASAVTSADDAAPAAFAPRVLSTDVATDWEDSALHLQRAFAEADPARAVLLPEISTEQRLPTGMVVGFHLLDTVVHGWDIATTVGAQYLPDPELVAAVVPMAEMVPDGPEFRGPGCAFAPRLDTEHIEDWNRVLTLLGRSPR